MLANGTFALVCALALFSLFFTNVALGASGSGAFLDDVGEMLMLFASATFFVIGVLLREARAKRAKASKISD